MRKFKQIFDKTYQGKPWKKQPKFVFKFTWAYCGHCECMYVICPKCGNNCCNAGFGEVTEAGLPKERLGDKGKTCDVCNLAYQYQHLAWKTKTAPKPTKRDLERAKKAKIAAEKGEDSWAKLLR